MRYVALICAAFVCLPMAAQTESGEDPDTTKVYYIDEVTTTGTRTAKRIIDVPYSVDVIDNVQYKFDKKVSSTDVLGTIPGLFLQNRYGNHDVRFSIRGFGSRSNSGIRGVRILLDDIPESEPDGQTRIEAIDFQSIGTIEIVKGNSSSLYTNAPGGVVNFINDIAFPRTHATAFSQFGSFGMTSSGLKTGLRGDDQRFLATYNYHSSRGYREHSEDFWHIFNTVTEIRPTGASRLAVLGYYVDGLIRLPGSLTRAQFDEDPFQANARDAGRDAKRITKKGRLGLRYTAELGSADNELEVTGYGTMKYFERTARTYRFINRSGVGATTRFIHRNRIFDRPFEVSAGVDLFNQYGPVEEYPNISGSKGEPLISLTNEVISNVGAYFQTSLGLIENKLDFLFTGRFDNVVFQAEDQNLAVRNSIRRFDGFTPKMGLTFKITPMIAAYTSAGFSFDSPAANELDNYPTSSNPVLLLNPDLQAQESRNFELGVKGNLVSQDAAFLPIAYFEVTFFNSKIEQEIVPFEVFGEVFYRNAAVTNRSGIEVGVDLDIVHGLKWKTAYTFSGFTYDEYAARTVDFDTSGNLISTDASFAGNEVPSVPKHNFSTALSYEFPLSERATGFVKGTCQSVSGMYTDDANSERSDGYVLFGTNAGVDVTLGRLNLLVAGGMNNIMDKTYVAFININSAAKEFYEAGEPRNYYGSINLGYQF